MAGGAISVFNDKIARHYDDWYTTREGHYFDVKEKKIIRQLLKPREGESLLDIGCGTGHFLEWFKTFGLALTGVDNSKAMLEVAKQHLTTSVSLIPADAQNLPFPDNSFDMVTMITVLEFLDQPDIALKEALRVARSRMFLGILNKYSILSLRRKIKRLFKPSIYAQAKFYSIWEIFGLIKSIDGDLQARWQTTASNRLLPNPFGGFIGILIT